MEQSLGQRAVERLESLSIKYEYFTHRAAATMEICRELECAADAKHCKNLFLTNRQGNKFYLVLTEADKRFYTKQLSGQLGISRLSFATDEQLFEQLGLRPGAVTPLALVFREGMEPITVAVDDALLRHEHILVHPCENTASVKLKTEELLRFIRTVNGEENLKFVTLTGEDVP